MRPKQLGNTKRKGVQMKNMKTNPCQVDDFLYEGDFLYDNRLSLRAKGLFAQMMSYPIGRNVKAETFAKLNGVSCNTIYNILRELEQKGYVKQVRCRQEGQYASGINYVLYPAGKGTAEAVKRLGV